MPQPPSRRPVRHLPHALQWTAVALALALPWNTAAFAQTRPLSDTPPSRLGTDGEGERSTAGATMHHRAASGSTDLQAAAMRHVRALERLEPSGNADHDFARLLQAQQRHALEMARIQLQHGKDPELRRLAQQLLDEQGPRLRSLEQWQREHPEPAAPGQRPARP